MDAGEVPEDVDVFKLAGPSDEESNSEDEEDDGDDDDSESGGEWVMADSFPSSGNPEDLEEEMVFDHPGSEEASSSDEEPPAKMKGKDKEGKKRGRSKNVFASAEDYAELIAQDKPVGRKGKKRHKA